LINSVNTETRRKFARTKVASNEIVYLHFETGNGGIVLDVSTEGLGFQAADPLQSSESLPFRLSLPGFPEIALSGQIVWLDSTRKRGGMRLNVPAESLALFQKWQRKYLDSAAEPDDIPAAPQMKAAPARAAQVASEIGRTTENRAPAPTARPKSAETQLADSAPAPQPEAPRTSPPPPTSPFARRPDSILGTRGPIFVSEWEVPPDQSRTGRNILVACVIIALCFVIAGGSYYLAGKRTIGNMLINLGQQIGGGAAQPGATASQPASPGSQSALGTAAPSAPSSSSSLPQGAVAPNSGSNALPGTAPNAQPNPAATLPPGSPAEASSANSAATSSPTAPPQVAQPANTTPASPEAGAAESLQSSTHNRGLGAVAPTPPDAHPHYSGAHRAAASTQAAQAATAPVDNGGADLDQALKYLQGPNSQDSAVAEEFLWSAIGEGSTQADLVLGDLYMRGQGAVHRNCRQAEVLLHAALQANVLGAEEKIQQLQTYGCH
jgi:PilZ domain